MKKTDLITTLCLFAVLSCTAQDQERYLSAGRDHQVALGLDIPLGVFARSHFGGAGLSYGWSQGRFGTGAVLKKRIGFSVLAGAGYYFGKKINPVGYPFEYGGNLVLRAYPGIIANPSSTSNIAIYAGPVLSVYKSNSNVGGGMSLTASYAFSRKFAVGPALHYRKHLDQDALWSAGVSLSYLP